MSRKVSDDKYKKTLSHKLETWFYGSEDVYVNHVEMKWQVQQRLVLIVHVKPKK